MAATARNQPRALRAAIPTLSRFRPLNQRTGGNPWPQWRAHQAHLIFIVEPEMIAAGASTCTTRQGTKKVLPRKDGNNRRPLTATVELDRPRGKPVEVPALRRTGNAISAQLVNGLSDRVRMAPSLQVGCALMNAAT
jgi:hypothetical protein